MENIRSAFLDKTVGEGKKSPFALLILSLPAGAL